MSEKSLGKSAVRGVREAKISDELLNYEWEQCYRKVM